MTTRSYNPPDRRALHAYVSEDAHEQWHDFAAEQGTTVSALLEALAPELNLDGDDVTARFGARLNAVVVRARKIDSARRRRTR